MFSSSNQKPGQVMSSSSHNFEQDIFASQAVTNRSLSDPPLVAGQFEHTPDVDPTLPQKSGVGVPSGRVVAGRPLAGGTSLPSIQFGAVEGAIRYFQLSGQSIPSHFLETLHSVMVVSEEHDLVGGDALADSLVSAANLHDRHSGSLINLLYQAVGISSSLPVIASSSGGVRQLDEVGSLGVHS